MNGTLQNLIREELCQNGMWQLSDVMKSALIHQICRLPKNEVSEIETRYPQSPAEMRAFLVKFFTRHYFQTQNSLIDYMTSQDFLDIVRFGHLRILDVGSGPAVASLAITDMLAFILEYLKYIEEWPKDKTVKMTYVLNDTSGICLGTGQCMLTDYFRISKRYNKHLIHSQTISIQKAFPDNLNQLQRVRLYLGTYDIAIFSYVVSPLNEDKGFDNLVNGLSNIETLCRHNGRILILQDKFQAALVRRISRAMGISSHKKKLTQYIYPSRNINEAYTYSYYECLYAPIRKTIVKASCIA
jgi:SAM-dependent methyltransferase